MVFVMILVVVLMVGAGDGYRGDACRDGGDVGGDCDDGGGSDCSSGGWIGGAVKCCGTRVQNL